MKLKWLVILVFLMPVLTSAQEVGVFITRIYSDNAEMENPFGLGVFFSKNISRSFIVGISCERFANERTYDGYTCVGLGFDPVWEPIKSSVNTNILKLRLTGIPLQYEYISFGVGSAVSMTFISISKRGSQTGRSVPAQGGQKFGYGFSMLARVTPLKSLPLKINVEAQRDFLGKSKSFATDTENPFYGKIVLTNITIGVSYSF